jgi:hypothetical protein
MGLCRNSLSKRVARCNIAGESSADLAEINQATFVACQFYILAVLMLAEALMGVRFVLSCNLATYCQACGHPAGKT